MHSPCRHAALQDGVGSGRPHPSKFVQEPADPVAKLLQVTCARCHKLTHEGRVASERAEKQVPHFDLTALLLPKLNRRRGRPVCLLVVVDVADFDGSLPRCGSGSSALTHGIVSSTLLAPQRALDAVACHRPRFARRAQ